MLSGVSLNLSRDAASVNDRPSEFDRFAAMEQPAHQRSLPYNPALDGLRGVAILLVVLHHAMQVPRDQSSPGSWFYSQLSMMGWIGVDLFFVLSGYLISAILWRSFGREHWLRNFLARRALRVLPLYFVVVLVCFNVLTWIPRSDLNWLRELAGDQWWYWLHLANFRKIYAEVVPGAAPVGWFSTYWSLSIEEHFYLVWPLVMAWVRKQNVLKVAVVGILGVNLLRIGIAWHEWPEPWIYNNTLTRVDGLLLGSAMAVWNEGADRPVRWKAWAWLILAGSVLCFWLPPSCGWTEMSRRSFYGAAVLYPASVFGSAALLWLLIPSSQTGGANQRTLMTCSFANPILKMFGKYSYAIYVFNKPIIFGIATLVKLYLGPVSTIGACGIFALICGACLAVARISWLLIEQPCLRWKRFFPSHT